MTQTDKKQTYYLEVKGRPGRIYIRHLEFGSRYQLSTEGSVSLRALQSPAKIYPFPGFHTDPLFNFLSAYYARAQSAASRPGGQTPPDAVIPECIIGVETKENGTVSLDLVYRLKRVVILDQHPYRDIPAIILSFFDSEKLWRTWA